MYARLGSPWVTTVEGLAAALALRAAGRPSFAAAVAAPSAIAAGKVLKRLIGRPRPGFARFARNGTQSFPSTHVAGPVALLTCVWCLAPRTKGWRAALTIGGGASLLLAVERVCAGKHWATDVAAGAVFGAFIGTALGRLAARRDRIASAMWHDGLEPPSP